MPVQSRFTEAKKADLKKAIRGVMRKLDTLERNALGASRTLVRSSRQSIEAAIPDEPTPASLSPFLGRTRTELSAMSGKFETLVNGFAREAANLGTQFAGAQLKAAGIEPGEFTGAGLTSGEVSAMATAVAAEARSSLEQVSARITTDVARAFTAPKPSLTSVRKAVRSSMSTTRKGGSLSGAIAKIAANIRTKLGQMFSASSEEVQKAAVKGGKQLGKIWVHQGDAIVRDSHLIAGAKYSVGGKPGPIPISKRFKVGQARLRFPRDPDAKGSSNAVKAQVNNCRCDSVTVPLPKKKRKKKKRKKK